MRPTRPLPNIAIVRVLTSGGPYRTLELLSLAFVEPTVGRLVAHAPNADDPVPNDDALVPESISVLVVHAAQPYAAGLVLTLSFVDPGIARIHAPASDGVPPRAMTVPQLTTEPLRSTVVASPPPGNEVTTDVRETARDVSPIDTHARFDPMLLLGEEPVDHETFEDAIARFARAEPASHGRDTRVCGVEVRLEWTSERARRFTTVVDKLFTVERLGWYRHVLAMRLLVPDIVSCGDAPSDLEAMRHLHALRAASVETLGRPLIAAFMPSFVITPEWLASIDSVSAARALAGLRDAIAPFVTDLGPPLAANDGATWTFGRVDRHEFEIAPAASVEALLPIFIANVSAHPLVTERLSDYRRTLIDVFSQTARSAEAVRLGAMAQPNHSLDDRLWQLVGTVGEVFGGLAVA